MTSKFQILEPQYPKLYKICEIAEELFHIDHNSTVSKLRLFTEKVIELIYRLESIDFPGTDMVTQIKELHIKNCLPTGVKDLFHQIRKDGNNAIHRGDLSSKHAFRVLSACYRISIWIIETYDNIYVEDFEYVLPDSASKKPVQTLEAEIVKSPLISENSQVKVLHLNSISATIGNRRQRSRESAKRLKLSPMLISAAWGLPAAFLLAAGPIGWATSAISGLGYLGYKYRKQKKTK
ncbi:DUF4145 domain-containing protein [Salegentibacter sp. LM13S]|uniref:DUF4145 domain-containing protein n=1 Tax=Salegentibacter lacus TaxID=2873599 RepID=UPI001CCF660A|nr:DUF4145 domain-containing protein [Salegentibacter lacus]MBZ9631254.1 DUF4145 domain-containing protein [Salegentibacter lacus]